MGKQDKKLAAAGGILLCAALVLQLCARNIPAFAAWYVHTIYPLLVGIVGRFFGILPLSVVEFSIYILLFGAIVYAISRFRKPMTLIIKTFFLISSLFFLYTVHCGINYYGVPFSTYAGIETGLYSTEELEELCEFLIVQINENLSEETYKGNQDQWKQEGIAAMKKTGEEYAGLGGFYPQPKEVTMSWILSIQQLSGIYVPFTIEANFNGAMTDYNIPHTICHELSHLKGFMREDEANFIGYLACIRSERQAFRYSGYLTGWVYAGNALYRADPEAYFALSKKLDPIAQRHLTENNVFWQRYEGKVAEVANQINDTYLKINDQSDGVKSYGRVVDLMLADYVSRCD